MAFVPNPEDEAVSEFVPPEKDLIVSFTPNPEDQVVESQESQKTEPGGTFTQLKIGLQQSIPLLSENIYNTLAGFAQASKQKALGVIQGAQIIPPAIRQMFGTGVVKAPKTFEDLADVGGEIAKELEVEGERTMGPDLVRKVFAQTGNVAPSLAISPFGFASMIAVAGAQSFGSTFRESKESRLAKGETDSEANQAAIKDGLVSGLTTAIVTGAFGKTGIEAVKAVGGHMGAKAAIGNILKQGGLEATEESVDQTLQAIEQKLTFNPDLTIEDATDQVITAAVAGGAFGTAVATPVSLSNAAAEIGPATSEALGVEPALAAVAPGAGDVESFIASKTLPDNPQIKEAIKKQDVMAGRAWINSPEYLFRNDPIAKPLVSSIVEAQLEYTSKAGQDDVKFKELSKNLDEADLREVTTKMREIQQGKEGASLEDLPENQQVFAKELRGYFDQWRETVRGNKRQRIVNALPKAQSKVLQSILEGTPKEQAIKSSRLKDAGKKAIDLALEEIESVNKWGIDDYITNAERGSWRIVDDNGTTVAVRETKTEARIEAEKYLKDNPETKTLTLTDEFEPGGIWPTQLTRGAYFRLLSNAKDALDVTAKEMQDILRQSAPFITMKPTQKYSKFLQERKNVLKGEDNIMDILPSYIYSMHKKQALDPVLRESKNVLPQLGPESRTAIENLLQDVKGRKSVGDRIADQLLSWFDLKPFAYSRAINAARNFSAHLKLGYRPVSVFINRIGGLHHTWTKTGFKDLIEGKKWVKSEEGKKALAENENRIGLEAAMATESSVIKEEPWYKPLGLFQKMEHFNRPEAFGAFYIQGTTRLGLEGEEAITYAVEQTRLTQFVYNTAALPASMRGPTGRLIFQFKPYLLKEMEFLTTLTPAQWGRYLTGFLALGGPRAAVILLRSLPVLGAMGFMAGLEDWLNSEFPEASRGIAGFFGMDVSPAAAPQLPKTKEEFAGPVLGDLLKLWNNVLSPALQGEERDWNDVKEWAVKLAPSVYYMEQATEAMMDENGWVKDSRGRRKFQPSKWDKIKLMLGTKPLEQSIEEVEVRYLQDIEDIARKNRKRYIDDLSDAIINNDDAQATELIDMAQEYGFVSSKDLMQAVESNMRGRELGPKDRLFQRLLKSSKAREIERFEP